MRKQLYWLIRILEGRLVPDNEVTAILDSFEAGEWSGTRFNALIMQCIRFDWNVPENMIKEAKELLEEMRT